MKGLGNAAQNKSKASQKKNQPDEGENVFAESAKEYPAAARIGFPVIAFRTGSCQVSDIVDVIVRNKDSVRPMLVSQIDGNDMVNLHRIARHNASTIRAHVELSKNSGMIQDIPVSVILRPFILFPVISHGRQPNGPKDAPGEPCVSGTLPADGPETSFH